MSLYPVEDYHRDVVLPEQCALVREGALDGVLEDIYLDPTVPLSPVLAEAMLARLVELHS